MNSNAPQTHEYNGVSQKQTMDSNKDSESVIVRRILRNVWNKQNVQPTINGRQRVIDAFRAVNNLGDYLARPNYVCNIPNQVVSRRRPGWTTGRNAISQCDGTGVPGASCNPRFVSDSSDYTAYKAISAQQKKYNSISTGGKGYEYNNPTLFNLYKI